MFEGGWAWLLQWGTALQNLHVPRCSSAGKLSLSETQKKGLQSHLLEGKACWLEGQVNQVQKQDSAQNRQAHLLCHPVLSWVCSQEMVRVDQADRY